MANKKVEKDKQRPEEDTDRENREDLEKVQQATLNITEDLERRKRELEESQGAYLNIMEDMERKRKELEESQRVSLNIMEDLDRAYKELRASSEREKELAAQAARAEVEKKRVAELEKAYNELRDTQAQLVQSAKLSALGELTAGVAHELNQPLNNIKIIGQSMLRDIQKGRYRKEDLEPDLKSMVNQVDKITNIIDHMRIFTRRVGEVPKEGIDVNVLVEGAFKFIGQQLKDHNIEVIKQLGSDLPKPIGYPNEIEQVILNLITNARNAVENSGKVDKRIEIETYKLEKEQSPIESPSVIIEVKDNGSGIPEHLREKIFEPFFTTSKPGEGTGLGLSITKRIIEEHKGRIILESRIGEGTTFKLILPVSRIGEHE